MEVPREERRELFFRDIERGDIVIGRITSIREFGFFMVLICLGSGVIREIADLEITVRYSFGQYFNFDIYLLPLASLYGVECVKVKQLWDDGQYLTLWAACDAVFSQ